MTGIFLGLNLLKKLELEKLKAFSAYEILLDFCSDSKETYSLVKNLTMKFIFFYYKDLILEKIVLYDKLYRIFCQVFLRYVRKLHQSFTEFFCSKIVKHLSISIF